MLLQMKREIHNKLLKKKKKAQGDKIASREIFNDNIAENKPFAKLLKYLARLSMCEIDYERRGSLGTSLFNSLKKVDFN